MLSVYSRSNELDRLCSWLVLFSTAAETTATKWRPVHLGVDTIFDLTCFVLGHAFLHFERLLCGSPYRKRRQRRVAPSVLNSHLTVLAETAHGGTQQTRNEQKDGLVHEFQ